MVRVRVVARFGGPTSPLGKSVGGSVLAHVGFLLVLLWLPGLRARPMIPPDAVIVDLVTAAPASRPEVPPAPSPPAAQPPRKAPAKAKSLPEDVKVSKNKKKPRKPEEKPAPATPTPPLPAAAGPPQEDPAPGSVGPTVGDDGSSVTALDVGDLEFAWYRDSVTSALHGNWRKPILRGIREPLEVSVAFEILRTGAVRGLSVEASSGVPSLDRSALRAVQDAAPLPPLPANWRQPVLEARFVFRLYPD